jgi:hypothetical protein
LWTSLSPSNLVVSFNCSSLSKIETNSSTSSAEIDLSNSATIKCPIYQFKKRFNDINSRISSIILRIMGSILYFLFFSMLVKLNAQEFQKTHHFEQGYYYFGQLGYCLFQHVRYTK